LKHKCLFIFGTRPEAIKMAPVIKLFTESESFDVRVCLTAQHREMLDQVMEFFNIPHHYDLDIMTHDQSLYGVTARIVEKLESIMNEYDPDYVFVQGDTTSTFIGALTGYYNRSKVVHIEAGLRTGNRYSPFPEEVNRSLVGRIADYHFTPTPLAENNLKSEGIKSGIFTVGNTVIDSLFEALKIIDEKGMGEKYEDECVYIDSSKKLLLVTGHRRESFGEPFKNICRALNELAARNDDIQIIYPVHLNPNVQKPVYDILGDSSRIHLIEPVDYPRLVWLMSKAHIVLTDSGGIQEEAPSLGKPVLVMRDVTERQEGVDAGTAKMVGTNYDAIVGSTEELLKDEGLYSAMSQAHNPYGDGKSSGRMLKIIQGEDI
jgi:UDP-N-acetylglucosamine 2-epimerase (non-hydrolysing)